MRKPVAGQLNAAIDTGRQVGHERIGHFEGSLADAIAGDRFADRIDRRPDPDRPFVPNVVFAREIPVLFCDESPNLIDLNLALKQLPNRKQFEDLLRDISTAGKKVGVTIKSIDRDSEVERDFYAEVPFMIELEGTYHDLARFFEMLASLPRIVNIGGLEIKVAKESRQSTVLKVTGRATTFRFLSGEA